MNLFVTLNNQLRPNQRNVLDNGIPAYITVPVGKSSKRTKHKSEMEAKDVECLANEDREATKLCYELINLERGNCGLRSLKR